MHTGSKTLAETETQSMVSITNTILIKHIKWISSILFIMIIFISCSKKSNTELLLGKWKLKSITDLDKNTTQNFQSDELIFMKITKDSIFQYENTFKDYPDKCGWKITNDSIYLTQNGYAILDYKILDINDEELKVQNILQLKSDGKITIRSNKIELYERLK